MDAIQIILTLLGPGSLFLFVFFAFAETMLGVVHNPTYYLAGKGKLVKLDKDKLFGMAENTRKKLDDGTWLIRMPIHLFYYRILIDPKDNVYIKPLWFLWLGQFVVIFTTLLLWNNGQTERFPAFPLGLEFLFGGLHLSLILKFKQTLKNFKL